MGVTDVRVFSRQGQAQGRPMAQGGMPRGSVGVVVTCHNYARYLRQCLESILGQTVRPAGVVVVDDASSDETPAVCREHAGRIASLRGEWRDVAKARNAGAARLPRADHYLFVDADNYLPPGYLEALLHPMTDPRVGVAYAPLDRFTDDGRELGHAPCVRPFRREWLRRQNLADTCSLVRRQAFEQVGGWRTFQFGLHDWDLWTRIARYGWQFHYCDATALRYRVHPGAMSEGRRGNYECGVAVMRESQLTCIVTLFSGRGWMLERWFAALAALRWNRENLHLIALDNSRDEGFRRALRGYLGELPFTHTYLRDDGRVLEGEPSAAFSDDAAARTANASAMNVHLARLYGRARQYVPAGADLVWSIEDDVTVPPDALHQLALTLFRRQAGAVSGCLRSRFQPDRLIAWTQAGDAPHGRSAVLSPPAEPMEIAATGFYCLLLRRDVFDGFPFRPGGASGPPYYDWAACADLRAAGERIWLTGDVRCGHWMEDGQCLVP